MHRLSIISIRGPATPSLPRLFVAAFLLYSIAGQVSCDTLPVFTDLPRTDGTILPPPLTAVSPEENERLFAASRLACKGPCVTPFGQVLGIADRAMARSNCVSTCVQPEFSFLDLKTGAISVSRQSSPEGTLSYIGITYQCVAYARQWWMKNLTLSFGDVDNAYHIFYLTEGINPRTGDRIPLGRSVNGSARRPPQRGDLVIYAADRSDPDWRSGHVAVVVAVNREQGLIALAEENYDNRPWQNPQAFAREIQLFEINGRFTLLDVSDGTRRNSHGGQIVGWIYPTP